MKSYFRLGMYLAVLLASAGIALADATAGQQSAAGITHSFLAPGGETYIMSGEGKITWRFAGGSRGGGGLPSGDRVVAGSKSKDYSSGAVVVIGKDGKVPFQVKGNEKRRIC